MIHSRTHAAEHEATRIWSNKTCRHEEIWKLPLGKLDEVRAHICWTHVFHDTQCLGRIVGRNDILMLLNCNWAPSASAPLVFLYLRATRRCSLVCQKHSRGKVFSGADYTPRHQHMFVLRCHEPSKIREFQYIEQYYDGALIPM